MNDTQVEGLVGAMLAEQKSLRQDMVALGRMVDEKNPVSQQQAQAALQNRQAASNQRVLDAVAPQLSAQQLTLLGVQLGQPDAMERAKKRVWERVEVAR